MELTSFIVHGYILRRFVPNFAQIMILLNEGLKKYQVYQFDGLS